MIDEKEIRRDAAKHMWRALIPIAMIQALVLFCGEGVFGLSMFDTVIKATSVAFLFSFIEILTVSIVWSWVARLHSDSLPLFYTFCSAFRILLALFVLLFVYIAVGRDNMAPYIIAFIVYYFVLLICHTLFFRKETKKLFDNK